MTHMVGLVLVYGVAVWAGLTVALYALGPHKWRAAALEALGVTAAIAVTFAVAYGIVLAVS